MKVKFIKRVDHIQEGTVRDFKDTLAKELIKGGHCIEVKEDKPSEKRETKELKKVRKTK